MGRDDSVSTSTGWKVRVSDPGGGARFSVPVQIDPGAHPASYTMGAGSLPGRGVDQSPPSSTDVKERVER